MINTVQIKEEVTIKFAGDSGDGMQFTGNLFTEDTALVGNDLATFPDYPAEIRAPIGTLAGGSITLWKQTNFYARRPGRCTCSYECRSAQIQSQ